MLPILVRPFPLVGFWCVTKLNGSPSVSFTRYVEMSKELLKEEFNLDGSNCP